MLVKIKFRLWEQYENTLFQVIEQNVSNFNDRKIEQLRREK